MAARETHDQAVTVVSTEPEAAPQPLEEKSFLKFTKEMKGREAKDQESKNDGDKLEEKNGIQQVISHTVDADPREYACHGLGKGIDATAVHPWESRSPYEARAVTTDDIVVLYEGMRVHQYTEQIDSYYDIQSSIETSLKIPNKPIEMGVAADASRSSWFSKLVSGKKVLKSTIAFDRKTQLHSSEKKSNFERDLENWLITTWHESKPASDLDGEEHEEQVQQCLTSIKEKVKWAESQAPSSSGSEATKAYDQRIEARQEEELAKVCKQFLLSLGGITHYISSITLGAMEYSQSKSSSKKTSFSQSTTVGVERVTTSKVKVSGSKSLDKFSRNTEKLGRFQYDQEGKMTDYIADQEEAVVHYAFTPLSSLVKRQDLSKAIQQAIQDYTNEQLSTHSGPYYISCTEPMDDHTLYWKIEQVGGRYVVKLTFKYKDASKFFIELDRHRAGGFFFISTTDGPTEPHNGEVEKNRPEIKRYIHMEILSWLPHLRLRSADITLAAYATVVNDSLWTTARFQIVDHQSRQKRSLEQSDWLPDKGRLDKSQPCFLVPRLHRYCLGVVRKRNPLHEHIVTRIQRQTQPQPTTYGFCIDSTKHHREGKCHMLFTLTRPPSDYGQSDSQEKTVLESSV